jgi:hypothetical protein
MRRKLKKRNKKEYKRHIARGTHFVTLIKFLPLRCYGQAERMKKQRSSKHITNGHNGRNKDQRTTMVEKERGGSYVFKFNGNN